MKKNLCLELNHIYIYERLFEKKKEESRKDEEYLTTPPTRIVEKESLKGDCNTLNSHFLLNHDAYFYHKKSQKQHFVMLLLILGNEQHKGNKYIYQKGPISF